MIDLTQVFTKTLWIVIGVVVFVGCSNVDVKQTSTPVLSAMFSGMIEGRSKVILEPNESRANRVAVGFAFVGPVGAVATAVTEDGFSEPGAYRYNIRQGTGEQKAVVSRSVVEIGRCVEVISPDASDLDVLMVIASDRCAQVDTTARALK